MADIGDEMFAAHRKLDRSPENKSFVNLPQEDKKLISNLRRVMEGTHAKITQFRDEIDERCVLTQPTRLEL